MKVREEEARGVCRLHERVREKKRRKDARIRQRKKRQMMKMTRKKRRKGQDREDRGCSRPKPWDRVWFP